MILGFAVVAGEGCRSAPSDGAAQEHAIATSPRPARADAAIRDSVRAVLDRALRDSAFPGAIAVVGTKTGVITEYAVGHLDWAPSPVPDDRTL